MTLQEVIKSGKKFRRPNFKPYLGEESWLERRALGKIVFSNTGAPWNPRDEDITATDWILEEVKLEFAFKEIFESVMRTLSSSKSEEEFENNLKTALGFQQNKPNTHYCDGFFCSYCDEGNNEETF